MARIEFAMPEKFLFSTNLQVRITDMNYGGHLSHDRMISLLHEARVRFFQSYDLPEIAENGDVLLIADLGVVYQREAFYGDRVNIKIAIGEVTDKSIELFYVAYCGEFLIVRAKTGIVNFSTKQGKAISLPSALAELKPS